MKYQADLKAYTDINFGKNYNCFIAPTGEFYRVRETTAVEMPGEHKYRHVEWASDFVRSNATLYDRYLKMKELKEANQEFKRTYTEYDFLLTDCGWVAYTRWLERNRQTRELENRYGCLPVVCKEEMVYTPEQVETIKGLVNGNHALPGIGFLDRIRWSGDFAKDWYQENLLEEPEKRR